MPVELLRYPPTYCAVGVYRLVHDPKINRPIWKQTQSAAKKGLMAALAWSVVSLPLTRLYVRLFMKTAVFRYKEDSAWLGVSIYTYATWLLLLQQASLVLEYFVAKQLKDARAHAYEMTVASRGKDASFWGPYVEEWAVPPVERATRSMQRKPFLEQASNRLVRLAVSKILLAPLNFIPFIGLAVSAALSSVTLSRVLLRPFFAAKQMTPQQEELFIVERLIPLRVFGFVAALLERLPVVGLVFSISNRIAVAMMAHDYEKQQHAYAAGEIPRTQKYVSRTAQGHADDLPDDAVGGFPSKKGPVRLRDMASQGLARGSLLESDPIAPPPLPPRR